MRDIRNRAGDFDFSSYNMHIPRMTGRIGDILTHVRIALYTVWK